MPRKGRPPAPTALKVIKGERASRINPYPPTPLDEPPICPDWLNDENDRGEFGRVAASLYHAGLAKSIDSNLIAAMSALWRCGGRLTRWSPRMAC